MNWQKNAVVYQIYPRSFADSNGDGVGDLRGLLARLDYLQALGVDVLWLCPVYQSPNHDGGYDISDYQAIAPEFGTLADFDELLAAVHARGMRLIMDLVVNHTSDQHPWFVQSRQSLDNPYRDYYLWQPARDGQEPNNWGAHFGGSAWQHDAQTDQYYLHLFTPQQPDLNWANPAVRRAIHAMMRWWLDRGVDGFRMDTINMLSKAPGFPDAPAPAGQRWPLAELHFLNGPRLLDYLHEMKREVLAHYDVLSVGETPGLSPEQAAVLTDPQTGPLDMVFQFEQMALDSDPAHPTPKWTRVPWSLADLRRVTTRWQVGLHGRGWNSQYLSNHDVPRLVSRFGHDGVYRVQSAKLLATFLHTLEGTPYIYQGDEIGMTNMPFADLSAFRDVDALNHYREQVQVGGQAPEAVLATLRAKGRDNARTPMQWDHTPNAGFSTGTPWIAVNPNFTQINVQAALADPDSVYWHYRTLIALRRQYPVIVDGRYDLLLPDHPQVYAYTRTLPHQQLLVLLNFSAEAADLAWVTPHQSAFSQLLSNYPAPPDAGFPRTLRPYEARVYLRSEEGQPMT